MRIGLAPPAAVLDELEVAPVPVPTPESGGRIGELGPAEPGPNVGVRKMSDRELAEVVVTEERVRCREPEPDSPMVGDSVFGGWRGGRGGNVGCALGLDDEARAGRSLCRREDDVAEAFDGEGGRTVALISKAPMEGESSWREYPGYGSKFRVDVEGDMGTGTGTGSGVE